MPARRIISATRLGFGGSATTALLERINLDVVKDSLGCVVGDRPADFDDEPASPASLDDLACPRGLKERDVSVDLPVRAVDVRAGCRCADHRESDSCSRESDRRDLTTKGGWSGRPSVIFERGWSVKRRASESRLRGMTLLLSP